MKYLSGVEFIASANELACLGSTKFYKIRAWNNINLEYTMTRFELKIHVWMMFLSRKSKVDNFASHLSQWFLIFQSVILLTRSLVDENPYNLIITKKYSLGSLRYHSNILELNKLCWTIEGFGAMTGQLCFLKLILQY